MINPPHWGRLDLNSGCRDDHGIELRAECLDFANRDRLPEREPGERRQIDISGLRRPLEDVERGIAVRSEMFLSQQLFLICRAISLMAFLRLQ